jgi:hypothetical protein
MLNLYHNRDPLAMLLPAIYEPLWFSERDRYFTRVALIGAPLESIFALTNHFDTDWTQNAEIIWHATKQLRSTSIGDVIVSARGQAWMVVPEGFKELREACR